jgi:hypothetical protein
MGVHSHFMKLLDYFDTLPFDNFSWALVMYDSVSEAMYDGCQVNWFLNSECATLYLACILSADNCSLFSAFSVHPQQRNLDSAVYAPLLENRMPVRLTVPQRYAVPKCVVTKCFAEQYLPTPTRATLSQSVVY